MIQKTQNSGIDPTPDPGVSGYKCVHCGAAFEAEDAVREHVAAEHAASVKRDLDIAR